MLLNEYGITLVIHNDYMALFASFLALTQALLHATLCYARSRASKKLNR